MRDGMQGREYRLLAGARQMAATVVNVLSRTSAINMQNC